jgi:hypothetical protein
LVADGDSGGDDGVAGGERLGQRDVDEHELAASLAAELTERARLLVHRDHHRPGVHDEADARGVVGHLDDGSHERSRAARVREDGHPGLDSVARADVHEAFRDEPRRLARSDARRQQLHVERAGDPEEPAELLVLADRLGELRQPLLGGRELPPQRLVVLAQRADLPDCSQRVDDRDGTGLDRGSGGLEDAADHAPDRARRLRCAHDDNDDAEHREPDEPRGRGAEAWPSRPGTANHASVSAAVASAAR